MSSSSSEPSPGGVVPEPVACAPVPAATAGGAAPVVPEVVAPGHTAAGVGWLATGRQAREAAEPTGELEAHLLLLEERRRAYARLTELEAEVRGVVSAAEGANLDDEHDPEGATVAYERQRAASLRSEAAAHLAEVDAALDRLAAGPYGVCEGCGGPIGGQRLSALPAARLCGVCAGTAAAGPSPHRALS